MVWFIALFVIGSFVWWYSKKKGEGLEGLKKIILPPRLTNAELEKKAKELEDKATELEHRKILKQRINSSKERIKRAQEQ